MYHSIYFGEKNTWDDWHLIPSSRPTFTPPPVNTSYVEIPGADGVLDFTETLLKRPTYGNREGSFEFIVANGYADWAELYSEIAMYLHGRKMNCYLEDDPNYYYSGRFAVNDWKSDPQWSVITIDYNVKPYKYEKLTGVSGWSYKPFETDPKGVINDYREFSVSSSKTETVIVQERWTRPLITVNKNYSSSTMTLTHTFNGTSTTATLQNGSNSPENIVLKPGENTLRFSGSGKIVLDCRGGKL